MSFERVCKTLQGDTPGRSTELFFDAHSKLGAYEVPRGAIH